MERDNSYLFVTAASIKEDQHYLSMQTFVNPVSNQGVANIRIFEYIRIFSLTNIRSYHIRIIFLMRIYSI